MNRLLTFMASGLLAAQAMAQTADSNTPTLKQRLHDDQGIEQVRVPTDADRVQVHTIIREKNPDILYLDAHHVPCTEWGISREDCREWVEKALEGKKVHF